VLDGILLYYLHLTHNVELKYKFNYPGICMENWGKPLETSVRITVVPPKIQTNHFPIMTPEHYRYNGPLD
jgi:hypothetical protein